MVVEKRKTWNYCYVWLTQFGGQRYIGKVFCTVSRLLTELRNSGFNARIVEQGEAWREVLITKK